MAFRTLPCAFHNSIFYQQPLSVLCIRMGQCKFSLEGVYFFILWSVCRYHIEKQSLGLLCTPKVTRSAAIDDKLFDAPLSVGGISSPIEYNLDLDHNQTLTQTQIQVSTLTWPGSRLQFRLRFGQGCRAFQFQSRSIGSDIMANSFFVFFWCVGYWWQNDRQPITFWSWLMVLVTTSISSLIFGGFWWFFFRLKWHFNYFWWQYDLSEWCPGVSC